ncbi:MAG: hypothetical protein KatS3mg035_0444 [Bacteroidia bacterium]|nr:MAG: hypothetical protein KatS3mg035_0444 [Bacteroidia bacterium]
MNYQDITSHTTQKRFTLITVKQIHEVNQWIQYFKMPVVMEVYYKDGSKDSQKVWIEEPTHQIFIPNTKNQDIAFVLFDPGSRILKSITFPKKYQELKAQALNAPHMIDRYDALVALRDYPIQQKRELLIQVFQKEKFYAIRSEIVEQLLGDNHEDSYAIIQQAIKDPSVEVRRTLINKTQYIPKKLLPAYEQLLQDSSYNIVSTALEKLLYQYPENKNTYLKITEKEEGAHLSIKIKWHQYNALYHSSTASQKALVEYTSPSYEFITRKNAMEALVAINYCDEQVIANLIDAALSFNARLANPAIETLNYFRKQIPFAQILDKYYAKNSWEEWQRKILEPLLKIKQ